MVIQNPMQSPLTQQSEPYRTGKRVDDDKWRQVQDSQDEHYTVKVDELMDAHWAVGLMANTSGHLKVRLFDQPNGLPDKLDAAHAGNLDLSTVKDKIYVDMPTHPTTFWLDHPASEQYQSIAVATMQEGSTLWTVWYQNLDPGAIRVWITNRQWGYTYHVRVYAGELTQAEIDAVPWVSFEPFAELDFTTIPDSDPIFWEVPFHPPTEDGEGFHWWLETYATDEYNVDQLDETTLFVNLFPQYVTPLPRIAPLYLPSVAVYVESSDPDVLHVDKQELDYSNAILSYDPLIVTWQGPHDLRLTAGNDGTATLTIYSIDPRYLVSASIEVEVSGKESLTLPIIGGRVYHINPAEIYPWGTTIEGIHVLGV